MSLLTLRGPTVTTAVAREVVSLCVSRVAFGKETDASSVFWRGRVLSVLESADLVWLVMKRRHRVMQLMILNFVKRCGMRSLAHIV